MDNFDLRKYLVENKVTTNSKMLNENEETTLPNGKLKKVVIAGTTYEVGSPDPNDDGNIIKIEKHPKGYFIMGRSKREGYGYGVDMKGNIVDEDEIMEMTEPKKPSHFKMMKEESGNFIADFTQAHNSFVAQNAQKSGISHYFYEDNNKNISKGGRYKSPEPITKLALSTLKAAGIDSVEKLYSENNKEYNGETVEDFFNSLKVDMSYSGFGYTLIPGVYVSFEDYQGE